jgi:hypothetical protein
VATINFNTANQTFRQLLGNLTLMAKSKNREIGNRPFEEKREVYRESLFTITKGIAERYKAWNEKSVESRQTWMADQAVTIWKVSQMKGR